MTTGADTLAELRRASRAYCDLVQTEGGSEMGFLRSASELLMAVDQLAGQLPETQTPAAELVVDQDQDLYLEMTEMEAAMEAARAGALMNSYMSNYHRALRLMERRLGTAMSTGNVTFAQALQNESTAKMVLTDLLSVCYAGIQDAFELEMEKEPGDHVWYWRSQLTGTWAQEQLQPACALLNAYLAKFG
jgi:hypothetical protein